MKTADLKTNLFSRVQIVLLAVAILATVSLTTRAHAEPGDEALPPLSQILLGLQSAQGYMTVARMKACAQSVVITTRDARGLPLRQVPQLSSMKTQLSAAPRTLALSSPGLFNDLQAANAYYSRPSGWGRPTQIVLPVVRVDLILNRPVTRRADLNELLARFRARFEASKKTVAGTAREKYVNELQFLEIKLPARRLGLVTGGAEVVQLIESFPEIALAVRADEDPAQVAPKDEVILARFQAARAHIQEQLSYMAQQDPFLRTRGRGLATSGASAETIREYRRQVFEHESRRQLLLEVDKDLEGWVP